MFYISCGYFSTLKCNQEPVSSLIHRRICWLCEQRDGPGYNTPELRQRPRGFKAGAKLKAELADNQRCDKPSIPSVIMGMVNLLLNKIDNLCG